MRKKLLIIAMITCLLMAPLSVWAESGIDEMKSTITPRYAYVDMINTIFGISEGTAGISISVYENLDKPFDYSRLTVYLKKSSGTTVKTWTATCYPSLGDFNWNKTYALTSRGTYYVKAVNKLYKNGSLVETITTTSVQDTY